MIYKVNGLEKIDNIKANLLLGVQIISFSVLLTAFVLYPIEIILFIADFFEKVLQVIGI